ncbi:MAG: RagB/SusD family nutrient uptake outer membrane protein, partial [Bacteroidota bacterium]
VMKYVILKFCILLVLVVSCEPLDQIPETAVSTDGFFNEPSEFEISLNALYQQRLWIQDIKTWNDDSHHRGGGFINNAISRATLNPTSSELNNTWVLGYEAIKTANALLAEVEERRSNFAEGSLDRIEGEARAIRAYFYGRLLAKFGHVPLITTVLTVEESFEVVRAPLDEVKAFMYSEFDRAAELLSDSNENRATRGFALGMKARYALYMEDFAIARDAAKEVIDSGTYGLDPDFSTMFTKAGADSPEPIYFIPYSFELGITWNQNGGARGHITRNAGGFGAIMPTWEAMGIFECTDGQTIDQSPLYDPHDPFENRDPRMTETIVALETEWLGYIYQSHPDSLEVLQTTTGNRVRNNDTRANAIFASFTGFVWKKGIEQSWADNRQADPNVMLLRYGDVLLMYAEALIELNENLGEARDVLNELRNRAYGNSGVYPEITETDQAGLRTRLRRERRVELMFEAGLRFQDLMRWRVAGRALAKTLVGLPAPQDQDREQWPFNDQILPVVDEDGIVDVKPDELVANGFARLLESYEFDENRMYLWPIPAEDILLNSGLTQNPGY